MWTYYPDTGPLRRELYPRHLEFFAAGKTYRERCAVSANRVGKTEGLGGYETVLHLTGLYPDWWPGRRFTRPVNWWVGGDTLKTVRDIVQAKMLGPVHDLGTGMIPRDLILSTTRTSGIADAIDTVTVRHASGGVSHLAFKSYDQGRIAWQGTEQDGVWCDEEPPLAIWAEGATRTMTTGGMLIATFTPLEGLSETALAFLPGGRLPEAQDGSRYVTMIGWGDVPHLTEKDKAELLATYPPYQRDARSKGVPALGSGAIYPVPESDITVDDFPIPDHWPRVYGMDVGWNRTAAVWLAHDRETDSVYVYSEHYMGQAEPVIHAQSIKSRGDWIPGAVDPAARGRTQTDGTRLIEIYRDLGLQLMPAQNAVEAGIYNVWQRLSGGKLKVFKSCRNLLGEMRLYRRDDKGKVVKENDHACLHPDMRVITDRGAVPIAELVGRDGWLLTTEGRWTRFENVQRTRTDAAMVELEFSDGQRIRCTPDHLVLTPSGWVEARDMAGEYGYNAVSQAIADDPSWNIGFYLRRSRVSAGLLTGVAASISSGTASGCIAWYGRRITGQFQKACTSITRTATALTTRLKTWNSWTAARMSRYTWSALEMSSRLLRESLPPSGMGPSMGADGTGSTLSSSSTSYLKLARLSASSVASTSTQPLTDITDSAATIASPLRDARTGRTTWIGRVADAASGSRRTSTVKRSSVVAPVRCVSVSESSPSDAYCLSVPRTHALAVEGGVVVHNCDALRYGIVTGLGLASTVPVEETEYESAREGGWMGR